MTNQEPNLEQLHDAYVAAWMRDDPEAAMAFWSEDIVMRAPGKNPHSGTYRGKAEVKRNLRVAHQAQELAIEQQVEPPRLR